MRAVARLSALKFIFCQKKQEKEKMDFKAVGTAGEARFSILGMKSNDVSLTID